MILDQAPAEPGPLRRRLRALYRADETQVVEALLNAAELPPEMQDRIAARARRLVEAVRQNRVGGGGIDAFMHAYELSSKEGVVLMCLAEALLRIPDAETANALIKDKLRGADFGQHLGESDSLFVNASTWALMLTGRILKLDEGASDLKGILKRMVTRSGEPVSARR
jgi:RHH-type proline utilization regulon transcriptional repressor/proline dehydrogenase/delta 1-pyrroline-5-carboxylate dehydrogenase